MHPTFAAGLTVARHSLDLLAASIDGLPDAALDWTPVAGTSSIAVLAEHSVSSTRFWLACAAGLNPSLEKYMGEERPAAFRARGLRADAIRAELQQAAVEYEHILASGDDASLAATLPVDGPDGRRRTGAECLLHGIGHLREHVGQAQLMRDLWLSGSREGR